MSHEDLQQLLQQALAAQRAGDRAAAVRGFEAVLARAPENPHALNALGICAEGEGDYGAAAGFYCRAAAADPREPALWLNAAKAQRLMGDDAAELASLNAALAIDQRSFMALLRKAELHQRTGQPGLAAQAWTGVVAIAAQAEERPPLVADAMARGQAFLAEHRAALSERLDAGLAGARDGLDGRELRRFDAALDVMLGKRRVYVNECHGVHFPFLPMDEFFDRAHFPWMAALEAETPAIREEFRALVAAGDGPLRPYVAQDAGTPANKWTPLDHSLDWGAMFLIEYGVRDEALCARCPATMAALGAVPLQDIPARSPTAFFSLLKPRTHIPQHTGVTNLRTIIHLPLIVPKGCRFRVGGEMRGWEEGEAFAFDDTIEHEAWNDSDALRAVLIFDVWNPYITEAERRLVRLMFEATDASGLNPELARGAGFDVAPNTKRPDRCFDPVVPRDEYRRPPL